MLKYTITSRDINGKTVMDEVISTFDIIDLVRPGHVLKKNFLFSERVVKEVRFNAKSKLM